MIQEEGKKEGHSSCSLRTETRQNGARELCRIVEKVYPELADAERVVQLCLLSDSYTGIGPVG